MTKETLPGLNSLRMLRQRGIKHEVLLYPESLKNAYEVACSIGLPPCRVYKTLVAHGVSGKTPLLALVASDRELELRMLARAANQKRVRMLSQREAERLTGLRVGGMSALALLAKHWPVFLDSAAAEQEHIVMNAGRRGVQVHIGRADFIALTDAILAPIANPN